MMKYKKMMVVVLSMGMMALSACGNTKPTEVPTEPQTTQEQAEMMPKEIGEIDANSLTEVKSLATYFELSKGGGKYINFWVKNTGRNDIAIKINDKERRVIKTGDSGHISVKASTWTKPYTFNAVPTPNGGRISLEYRIAQRNELTP